MTGMINAAQCAGTYNVVPHNGATEGFGPSSPITTPVGTLEEDGWVIVVILVLVILLLTQDIAQGDTSSTYVEWEYHCTVSDMTVLTTGQGGYLRQVRFEAPDNQGDYKAVGEPCEYSGLFDPQCTARIRFTTPTPAGQDKGQDESQLPATARISVKPNLRAVNAPQHEPVGLVMPPITRLYSDFNPAGTSMTGVPITWTRGS
ncbi:MAG: hypothetical protein HYT80_08920 [Euryarchaeota archaeon]|nr:hypothetical protein [Euryarchaeota archaeon]